MLPVATTPLYLQVKEIIPGLVVGEGEESGEGEGKKEGAGGG